VTEFKAPLGPSVGGKFGASSGVERRPTRRPRDGRSRALGPVDNGKHEKFVRIDARNRDGDIVLGIPLPPSSAATLADQLRTAAEASS